MKELQRVLEAYRAMEPVREVVAMIKTEFEEEQRWATLEFQVETAVRANYLNSNGQLMVNLQAQVMQVVVKDPVCDDFAPQRKYTYRFLKSYLDGRLSGVNFGDSRVAETVENVVYR
ncbi:unnamed protein product [Phytophthora lilii]|uniref:Unnamed protein product n=1 Tax=Phytophthora lilii TaxID=2077276 RepID=A0A9W6X506_9STRA|nr:unnamed protein product [Phytophthora lilii]